MGPARHLVVFARAPRLGAVKRRLARDVGAVAAWRFYRETTKTLLPPGKPRAISLRDERKRT